MFFFHFQIRAKGGDKSESIASPSLCVYVSLLNGEKNVVSMCLMNLLWLKFLEWSSDKFTSVKENPQTEGTANRITRFS